MFTNENKLATNITFRYGFSNKIAIEKTCNERLLKNKAYFEVNFFSRTRGNIDDSISSYVCIFFPFFIAFVSIEFY